MKITASWNRKDGRPDYGNEGASISFTLEVPDALWDPAKHHELIQSARALTALAKQSVEQDLRLAATQYREQRERDQTEAAARHAASLPVSSNGHSNGHSQPFNEFESPPDDRELGDRGYQAPQQQRNDPPPQSRQADPAPGRQQSNDPPPARDDRPARNETPPRRDNRGGGRNDSKVGLPPETGAEMSPWIRAQPKDVEERVKRLMKANGWGSWYKELSDDEVKWLYRQTLLPESRSHAEPAVNGNGRY
jgi:hypothetical protein